MPLFKIVHLVDAPNKADAEAYTHLVAQAYINQGYHNHFVRIKVSKHPD